MADIELVIKIPKIEYEHLTNKEKFCALEKSKQEWLINKILNYVIDGTPLPEGHGVLKDADAMINKLCTPEVSEFFGSVTCAEILDFINDEKSIIEADKDLK